MTDSGLLGDTLNFVLPYGKEFLPESQVTVVGGRKSAPMIQLGLSLLALTTIGVL